MRQCSLHCFPFFLLCIRCTRPSWFYYRNEKKTVVSNLHSLSHRAHTYIETLTLIHLMQHPANCIKLSCCMFSIWNLNYIVFFNPFFPAIFISVQLVCWVRVLCACFSIQIALFSVFFIMRTFKPTCMFTCTASNNRTNSNYLFVYGLTGMHHYCGAWFALLISITQYIVFAVEKQHNKLKYICIYVCFAHDGDATAAAFDNFGPNIRIFTHNAQLQRKLIRSM